jgi:ABC-type transporter Mla MlaB component
MEQPHAKAVATRLIGDWTMTGVVQQVTRLTELEIRNSRPGSTVIIDCSDINRIDLGGFQLLYVWLHCIQLNGLKPELVNVPEWMREAQDRLRISQVFKIELQERVAVDRKQRPMASNICLS